MADAIGLGVFTAIGATKGATAGLGPMGIALMGACTATGGGIIRDVLANEIPVVLRTDVYATASIAGGLFIAMTYQVLPEPVLLLCASGIATGLRLITMRGQISMPKMRSPEE